MVFCCWGVFNVFFLYMNFHCCYSCKLKLILANFLIAVNSFGIVKINTSKSTLSLRADIFTKALTALFYDYREVVLNEFIINIKML